MFTPHLSARPQVSTRSQPHLATIGLVTPLRVVALGTPAARQVPAALRASIDAICSAHGSTRAGCSLANPFVPPESGETD
jgi:hypothetical protein